MQQTLILLALRPDSAVHPIQALIGDKLGPAFLEPPSFNLDVSFRDSQCCAPLVFVLSPGADPMGELRRLMAKMEMQDRFIALSLGQGQGAKAEKALDTGRLTGAWVVLQNCHLASSWMPRLETIVEGFSLETNNPEFRLWLTAMPSETFPVSILQSAIKMTNEPPKGLKQNLYRAYASFDAEWFQAACPRRPKEFRKLLFGLCFFHALIQERRKYGPLGWNIPYAFSESDREISVSQLEMLLQESDRMPWSALQYTAAEANYGGRVTDTHDRRTLSFALQRFYCEDILSDDYGFSQSGTYFAPPHARIEQYMDYIQSLPMHEHPEVFGLHGNANLAAAIAEVVGLLGAANQLQPRSGSAEGQSPEESAVETAEELLSYLPQLFDVEAVQVKYPVRYDESMNTVLVQELLRFNKLLAVVRKSLEELPRAVRGLIQMTPELEEVGAGLFTNKTPALWLKASYPSLKPLASYIVDLAKRTRAFFGPWVLSGFPTSFWLPGFFFTQSFLTGQLQNYARKKQLAIDTLEWGFTFSTLGGGVIQAPSLDGEVVALEKVDLGCLCYGLFIEGARLDHVLHESLPKVILSDLPVVHLKPQQEGSSCKGKYPCPLYKTSERRGTLSTTGHSTNFVMTLMVPMSATDTEKHWTLRGVAALLQSND